MAFTSLARSKKTPTWSFVDKAIITTGEKQ